MLCIGSMIQSQYLAINIRETMNQWHTPNNVNCDAFLFVPFYLCPSTGALLLVPFYLCPSTCALRLAPFYLCPSISAGNKYPYMNM